MDDRPGSDFERITSTPSTPFRRSASAGIVMSCSTSSAESPSASVWISTYGGVNSGSTSTGALRARLMPTAKSNAAAATIRSRNRRLVPMIERIIGYAPSVLTPSRSRPAVGCEGRADKRAGHCTARVGLAAAGNRSGRRTPSLPQRLPLPTSLRRQKPSSVRGTPQPCPPTLSPLSGPSIDRAPDDPNTLIFF